MPIEITVAGVNTLKAELTALIKRVDNPREALLALIEDFHQIEIEQFETEGARGGTRWAPLSPEYAGRKARQGYSGGILVRKGTLRRSLTQRGARFSRTTIRRRSLEIGTSDPVALYHQFGRPMRPVIVITKADDARWLRIVGNYVMGSR